MFRRTNSEQETPTVPEKAGGKGRPTPSRKEAEAAARARAKVPRTRKEQMAAQRFPDEPTKGSTLYVVMRSLQMKFLRMPKAQVKIGQKLPETYR